MLTRYCRRHRVVCEKKQEHPLQEKTCASGGSEPLTSICAIHTAGDCARPTSLGKPLPSLSLRGGGFFRPCRDGRIIVHVLGVVASAGQQPEVRLYSRGFLLHSLLFRPLPRSWQLCDTPHRTQRQRSRRKEESPVFARVAVGRALVC